jgi:hypothetical protein
VINADILLGYVRGTFPDIEVERRKDFFTHSVSGINSGLDILAGRLAGIKVLNPMKEGLNPDPIYGEIDYEKRKILNPLSGAAGLFYDGIRLQSILYPAIKKEEKVSGHLHIVITDRLVVTWDDYDRRYHLRVGVFGQPSVISTAGIVEAPAKPREFYILKQFAGSGDMYVAELKKRFNGRFIDYGDSRITGVMKGYLAQAIFYHITGDPFCDDTGCRLFNAHWQEEMIYAQIGSPYEFCRRHKTIIEDYRIQIAKSENPPPSPFSKGELNNPSLLLPLSKGRIGGVKRG